MTFLNLALFDEDGKLDRLIQGPVHQVELNIEDYTGEVFSLPLDVSDPSQVPSADHLRNHGKTYERR